MTDDEKEETTADRAYKVATQKNPVMRSVRFAENQDESCFKPLGIAKPEDLTVQPIGIHIMDILKTIEETKTPAQLSGEIQEKVTELNALLSQASKARLKVQIDTFGGHIIGVGY